MNGRKVVVSLSGGKDSTAMLLLMLERGERVDHIVFFDTYLEFPEMYDHLVKLQDYIGKNIEVIVPDRHFLFVAGGLENNSKTFGSRHGYGMPTFKRRWCTNEKISQIKRWKKENIQGDYVDCIGIASDEQHRVKPHPGKRYPLVEMGISEKQALKVCYDRGFYFGGLYKIFDRVSCWCCPLGGVSRMRKLYNYFPVLWEKAKLIEKSDLSGGETNSLSQHFGFLEGKNLLDLEKQFENENKQQTFWKEGRRVDGVEYKWCPEASGSIKSYVSESEVVYGSLVMRDDVKFKEPKKVKKHVHAR